MTRSLFRGLAALALGLALAMVPALAAKRNPLDGTWRPAQQDFRMAELIRGSPWLEKIAASAARHQVPFGIYGGTVRDLYLHRPWTVISDFDTIYDSSAPGFPAFRDEILGMAHESGGKMPAIDFHFDLSRQEELSERQEMLHNEGITITKVGVLADGRLVDSTGQGIADLRARRFRFTSPHPRPFVKMENLGRFVRDLVRFADLERDPETLAMLRRSVERHRDPSTPEGRRARAAAARLRALSGPGLVDFALLIGPNRRDIRRLHDGEFSRLTDMYPTDVFVFELFKAVTQAPKIEWLREVFRTLAVDRLFEDLGLTREIRLLMDPRLSQQDLFRAFQFPGNRRPANPRTDVLARWDETLRRYTYRVLFDMLASEFPEKSRERGYLEGHRDAFLSPGTWRTLSPGPEWREEVLGFLDRDFNVRRLPRARIERSLDWFLKNYLPLGERVLVPVSEGPALTPRAGLTRGWSREVSSVDPRAPHGMGDLPEYLERLVGKELIPLCLEPTTGLAFLATDRDSAARDLRGLGCTRVYQVNACGLSRRRGTLLGHDPAGRVIFAEYDFYSDEQLLNHQLRYRFLSRGAIPPERVHVRRETDPADFPGRARLERWARGFHEPVEVLFVSFTNPLKRLLTSWKPIDIGELKLGTGYLPGPGRRRALTLSAFGANHGSLPARVVRVLRAAGLKAVVLAGTAGGLATDAPRFAWVVPRSAALDGAPARAFDNRALALGLPGTHAAGRHVSVISPLVETRAWVDRAHAAPFASVDCELAHLVEELARPGPPVDLHALVNLTDFPAGTTRRRAADPDAAISLENSPAQLTAVESALRRIIAALERPR